MIDKDPRVMSLLKAKLAIQAMSPERWDRFIQAVNGYYDYARDQMLGADHNNIHRAQGWAQQAKDLLDLMSMDQAKVSQIEADLQKKQANRR